MFNETIDTLPVITLVGPPNSGKTTLFNYLSGKNYKTVNYPGSTVDYHESKILNKYGVNANLLDSPGIISLIPNSPDEKVSVDALYTHPLYGEPDIVIATVDASQISRHLLLAKQLVSSNFNVILVLTMLDILNKKGYDISSKLLSDEIGCKVIKLDGRSGNGVEELLNAVNQNLEKIKIHGKNKPVQNYKVNKDELLKTYQSIEATEHYVLYPLVNDKKIEKANRKLKLLVKEDGKRNCNAIDENTLRIDRILLHKYWGILIFFAIMSFTFTSIFWLAQPLMDFIDGTFGWLAGYTLEVIGNNWFGDLISNGLISGTGAVLVFIPQIIILFLILGLLEDSGYLARGAMLVDKPLSKIGLNGKSFVPMLSGFACAIPAMMAARTIPNRKERLLTIFILPLMSCSARLPVYTLLIGFLIPFENKWMGGVMLASIYIFGIFSSVLVSGIINKLSSRLLKENDTSSFILELPAYRRPKQKVVLNNTFNNAYLYIKRAGPTILTLSLVLWFLSYFPNTAPKVDSHGLSQEQVHILEGQQRLEHSYAASLGKIIQPIMEPVGMDWRVGVSLVSAFAAREIFVSSLAMIFKVTDSDQNFQNSILIAMREAKIAGTDQKLFTTATIMGLIVFFIFALQCISTIAISRKETGSWRIPSLQLAIYTSMAYILMFITVNGLRALGIE